ncbi:FAD-containing monooxygenase EthA [Mycolicibacterium duvalii]|uniref:FAD-containing monooxygenase EthA n=1 Tax=Mycolicibacterium duvalii TaxID=39688 RepID=A0A7I7K851_9MYCO|nr:NAD(P)/FAD-dependent oxidoreductase [Mycolicibacterium duvalii]MCV7369785.1 NAD(P)/FAD-dependent oxidoreductase [Mycolicibacterium duvalii]PEG35046.1 FAD-containing monooxygenase EthA [Mycolicibacterium duvalii]BBX19681.1 FAD-containing monooxygenase EthA [Mycolicibacterium duvalii]
MTEFVDVVIVGAGISGISAAWHLQGACPDKSYLILERRDQLGGTWDLFKYPGIRSDSDMYTLGFHFKPWATDQSIADGPSIWNYLNEAAVENGIDKHMRFGHKVVAANWSDEHQRWELTVEHGGEQVELHAGFLWACSGYYNYDKGYAPEFPSLEDFAGTVVHPQHWPEDLDYQGKKVVVIGSGATAITLIPAMVDTGAGHVTMLQRTPTYVGSLPDKDPFAARMYKLLPEKAAYAAARWKAILQATAQYQTARTFPDVFRKTLRTMAERRLPEGFDYDRHFAPDYKPWDQRVCLAPNGDIFKAIRKGKADVVTDTIERFTPEGILLTSGEVLEADIVITATGLNVQFFGGAEVRRNGEPVNLADSVAYKGMMLSGVPNMAFTFGYTNASWTLKADLTSEFVARLLRYMDGHGYTTVVPREPGADVERLPFVDLTSGYIQRAIDRLPKSGSKAPWRLKQNYLLDIALIRRGKVDDKALQFTRHRAPVATSA